MLTALKVTFLFIGTSIGAGFSSGREIALFFDGLSPWCVATSAIFIAILCALFLTTGKLGLIPNNYVVRLGTFFAAIISLISMLAGGEYILRQLFGIPLLGIVMAVLGAITVCLGIEKIKWMNTLLIPLLIALMVILFVKIGAPIYDGGFSIVKPIRYSGLDVLLAGILLSREGKKLTYRQIIISTVGIAVCMFAVLFVLQNVVLSDDLHSSMPVLTISEKVGLRPVCGILIAIAIFTTLIGALEIVTTYAQDFIADSKRITVLSNCKPFVTFGALLITYPFSFFGFEKIVDTCYPFVSLFGIAIVVWILIRLVRFLIKSRPAKASRFKVVNR